MSKRCLFCFQALQARRVQCEHQNVDPLVWTSHRVIKWIRDIDMKVGTEKKRTYMWHVHLEKKLQAKIVLQQSLHSITEHYHVVLRLIKALVFTLRFLSPQSDRKPFVIVLPSDSNLIRKPFRLQPLPCNMNNPSRHCLLSSYRNTHFHYEMWLHSEYRDKAVWIGILLISSGSMNSWHDISKLIDTFFDWDYSFLWNCCISIRLEFTLWT